MQAKTRLQFVKAHHDLVIALSRFVCFFDDLHFSFLGICLVFDSCPTSSPDGQMIATASWSGEIKIWKSRCSQTEEIAIGRVSLPPVGMLCWSHDASLLAVISKV